MRQHYRMHPCCNRKWKVEENFFRRICLPMQCCLKLHQRGEEIRKIACFVFFTTSIFPEKNCEWAMNNFNERKFDLHWCCPRFKSKASKSLFKSLFRYCWVSLIMCSYGNIEGIKSQNAFHYFKVQQIT